VGQTFLRDLRMEPASLSVREVGKDRSSFCDPKTGQPLEGNLNPVVSSNRMLPSIVGRCGLFRWGRLLKKWRFVFVSEQSVKRRAVG